MRLWPKVIGQALPASQSVAKYSPTSVHRCLIINEILCHIFHLIKKLDELPSGARTKCRSGRGTGKGTLASLARTCRTFSAPALDILWENLESLNALCSLRDPIGMDMHQNEASRLQYYVGRIKSISACFNFPPTKRFSLANFPAKSGLPLFHNLTKLALRDTAASDSSQCRPTILFLKYLAGRLPTLKTLSLTFDASPLNVGLSAWEQTTECLSNLPLLCPNVTSFVLSLDCSCMADSAASAQLLGEMVNQWKKLQNLQTNILPLSTMRQLASRRTIETLGVDVNGFPHQRLHHGPCRLPESLHELTLRGDPTYAAGYLENVFGNPKSLRFCLFGTAPGRLDFSDYSLNRLLSTHFDKTRLLSLTIQPPERLASGWHYCPCLNHSFVSQLLQFPHLQELNLEWCHMEGLENDEYARLSRGLKNLRSLKLGTKGVSRQRKSERRSKSPTLAVLVSVLSHCRELETLHITFHSTVPPPPLQGSRTSLRRSFGKERGDMGAGPEPRRPSWGVTNERITRICVGRSPIKITHISAIATCLRALMPRLEEIECSDRLSRYAVWKWKRVQDLLVEGG